MSINIFPLTHPYSWKIIYLKTTGLLVIGMAAETTIKCSYLLCRNIFIFPRWLYGGVGKEKLFVYKRHTQKIIPYKDKTKTFNNSINNLLDHKIYARVLERRKVEMLFNFFCLVWYKHVPNGFMSGKFVKEKKIKIVMVDLVTPVLCEVKENLSLN